jgi:hypothetical protein
MVYQAAADGLVEHVAQQVLIGVKLGGVYMPVPQPQRLPVRSPPPPKGPCFIRGGSQTERRMEARATHRKAVAMAAWSRSLLYVPKPSSGGGGPFFAAMF